MELREVLQALAGANKRVKIVDLTPTQQDLVRPYAEGSVELELLVKRAAKMAKREHKELWRILGEMFPEYKDYECRYSVQEGHLVVELPEDESMFTEGEHTDQDSLPGDEGLRELFSHFNKSLEE